MLTSFLLNSLLIVAIEMIIEGCICKKGIYSKLNMKISGETIQKE